MVHAASFAARSAHALALAAFLDEHPCLGRADLLHCFMMDLTGRRGVTASPNRVQGTVAVVRIGPQPHSFSSDYCTRTPPLDASHVTSHILTKTPSRPTSLHGAELHESLILLREVVAVNFLVAPRPDCCETPDRFTG